MSPARGTVFACKRTLLPCIASGYDRQIAQLIPARVLRKKCRNRKAIANADGFFISLTILFILFATSGENDDFCNMRYLRR
jgi:hypothetical protein